jgi:hypothetical protein
MDVAEIVWGVLTGPDWSGLANGKNNYRALVNVVMNLRVPYSAGTMPRG